MSPLISPLAHRTCRTTPFCLLSHGTPLLRAPPALQTINTRLAHTQRQQSKTNAHAAFRQARPTALRPGPSSPPREASTLVCRPPRSYLLPRRIRMFPCCDGVIGRAVVFWRTPCASSLAGVAPVRAKSRSTSFYSFIQGPGLRYMRAPSRFVGLLTGPRRKICKVWALAVVYYAGS